MDHKYRNGQRPPRCRHGCQKCISASTKSLWDGRKYRRIGCGRAGQQGRAFIYLERYVSVVVVGGGIVFTWDFVDRQNSSGAKLVTPESGHQVGFLARIHCLYAGKTKRWLLVLSKLSCSAKRHDAKMFQGTKMCAQIEVRGVLLA